MRERLARIIAATITALLVLMAAFFAHRRNDTAPSVESGAADASRAAEPPPVPAVDASEIARGRGVYEEQSCARCHSVEGRGNPRAPLDGVGARRSVDDLRDWVTAAGDARAGLSRSSQRAKDRFRELPAADLEALVAYLSTLR